jgi:hypothetical protein
MDDLVSFLLNELSLFSRGVACNTPADSRISPSDILPNYSFFSAVQIVTKYFPGRE